MTAISIHKIPLPQRAECARDLLVGGQWYWATLPVEHPGDEVLRQILASHAPRRPSSDVSAGPRVDVPPAPEKPAGGHPAPRAASTPRTIAQKRKAVADAFARHPALSAREIARKTGTSHRFVSLQRRKYFPIRSTTDIKMY
jgi:hypothetical protein